MTNMGGWICTRFSKGRVGGLVGGGGGAVENCLKREMWGGSTTIATHFQVQTWGVGIRTTI